ncbi:MULTISPECIES: hypothetical protein [Methylococcus]|uniref:hypothetical protein n=1 Tax=Methylococcus TaxID=413 RepID=UPI001180F5FB|nr:hypothetical protein [Methylococcus capsulatus]QXP93008.1 hypothetical protein KW113_11640 [Methylococcus capsulatus]
MKNFDLFRVFTERALDCSLESLEPQFITGWQGVEALWPLSERFRESLTRIRSLPYDASFEPEADAAIELLIDDPDSSWEHISAGAWRVLLERQQQAILVALANEAAGNSFIPIPPGLSESQRTVAVVLFLLHGMKLPWPPEDRSDFSIPTGGIPSSLRPH